MLLLLKKWVTKPWQWKSSRGLLLSLSPTLNRSPRKRLKSSKRSLPRSLLPLLSSHQPSLSQTKTFLSQWSPLPKQSARRTWPQPPDCKTSVILLKNKSQSKWQQPERRAPKSHNARLKKADFSLPTFTTSKLNPWQPKRKWMRLIKLRKKKLQMGPQRAESPTTCNLLRLLTKNTKLCLVLHNTPCFNLLMPGSSKRLKGLDSCLTQLLRFQLLKKTHLMMLKKSGRGL